MVQGGVTAQTWSARRLMPFVWTKDFNILITHLKVSVIMPIDQNHQKNAFPRDNVEQGGNATSLKVKWLQHLRELTVNSKSGAPQEPASADTASSSAKIISPLLCLYYSLLDLQPQHQIEKNGSSEIPVACSIKPKLCSNEFVQPLTCS